ncbi:hypothetical protein [Sediminimonas sp.]|uniref:hypothetical protein n=1 Tax=Sediminimonas sp. TaxID=2823379 RepID=UPI0025E02814|nr:hypothetical protein [Sediminimonas sp.]
MSKENGGGRDLGDRLICRILGEIQASAFDVEAALFQFREGDKPLDVRAELADIHRYTELLIAAVRDE